MCVGGKQEKKREHQYFSTAAECTVSLWWKKSFLSVSSHRDVKDVSAMPARIQWREILTLFSITLWWVSAIYNRAWILFFKEKNWIAISPDHKLPLVLVSNVVIQLPKPLFFSAWIKKTERPAALQQLQKHLCHPEGKSTITLQETQHSSRRFSAKQFASDKGAKTISSVSSGFTLWKCRVKVPWSVNTAAFLGLLCKLALTPGYTWHAGKYQIKWACPKKHSKINKELYYYFGLLWLMAANPARNNIQDGEHDVPHCKSGWWVVVVFVWTSKNLKVTFRFFFMGVTLGTSSVFWRQYFYFSARSEYFFHHHWKCNIV